MSKREQSAVDNKVEEQQKPSIPVRVVKEVKGICNDGDLVSLKAMLGSCDIKEQAGNKKYMIMDIQDATGVISAKVWHDSLIKIPEKMKDMLMSSTAENPVVVAIGGIRETWAGVPYINVKGLQIRQEEDPTNYVPSSVEDAETMYQYIVDTVSLIEEPYRSILLDKLEKKKTEFITAPAAKRYHDNFKCGLCEHTYKLLMSYISVANLYKHVNKSIMVYIIVEHDFEKINGYTLLPTIEWTTQEELVGHQVMGAINVYNDLKSAGVDDTSIMAILNALLAHHGKAEWGAAKPALTIEAKLLAHLDFMISDIAKANQIIEEKNCEEGKLDKSLFYVKY